MNIRIRLMYILFPFIKCNMTLSPQVYMVLVTNTSNVWGWGGGVLGKSNLVRGKTSQFKVYIYWLVCFFHLYSDIFHVNDKLTHKLAKLIKIRQHITVSLSVLIKYLMK